MKVLLVSPAMDFSVSDVARGYMNAFKVAGHEVFEYNIGKRMVYHARALGEEKAKNIRFLSKQATENIVVEALYNDVDLCVIVSGLAFHPLGLQLLHKAKIPTVIVHTESPYQDADQVEWDTHCPSAKVFTHEIYSAEKYGWGYLAHAYDPNIHFPFYTWTTQQPGRDPEDHWENDEPDTDVIFLGTAWPERIALFERVNWEGINVKFYGLWPSLSKGSKLREFYTEGPVPNEEAVRLYRKSKIALNFHRAHPLARSLNPRAFELAAVGTFTLTDRREEGEHIFGESQPTFTDHISLEEQIRFWLKEGNEVERRRRSEEARSRGAGETFGKRVEELLASIWKR